MLPIAALVLALGAGLSAGAIPRLQSVTLSGEVVAAPAKSPLTGATIEAGSSRATTDANGRFAITVPALPVRLAITANGYAAQQVDVVSSAAAIIIVLEPIPRVREEVTVAGRLDADTTTPASVAVAPREVFAVAGALDNVFRVLQTFPGVSGADEFGSRLTVRGGGPDQNLTVMDGLEIHNPYRLYGITSAFNPETIDRFELTAGGFSPKYGDRLSSLLVIDNREGRRDRRAGGSMSLALTDANVVFEGRVPGTTSGSWLVTARRTYYDLIANRLADTKLPQFADLQTKIAWDAHPHHRVSFLGLRSRETTDASFEGGPISARLILKNTSSSDLAAISVASAFGARATSRTILGWYSHGDTLSADGLGRNEAVRSNTPDDAIAYGGAAFEFSRRLVIRDVSLRHDLSVQASRRQLIQFGFEVHDLRTNWDWQVFGTRNPNEANGSSIQGGSALPSLLRSAKTLTRAGVWAIDRLEISPRLRVEPGVRVDRSGLARETTISPRLSAEVTLSAALRLRGAVGRFTQSPGYEKMLQGDYFVDLTSVEAGEVSSERATHAIVGLERRWRATSVRIEGYWKGYAGLILGRLENEAERLRRVAQYAYPPEFAGSVPTASQITTTPANLGTGRAYGFDVFVERKDGSRRARLTGWASYAWGRATMEAYGRRFPFDYDRRHALSAVGMYRWRHRVDVSGTWRIASGFPYTPVHDLIVASELDSGTFPGMPGSLVPAQDPTGRPLWTVDYGGATRLNSGQLPLFARLDARATFHSASPGGRWEFYVEVLNVLNRRNTGEFSPILLYDPAGDRPRLESTSENVLPRLPSLGVRLRF